MPERPLLTGRDAERARDAVRAAARGFAYTRAPRVGFDLVTGHAGLAIVHATLDRVVPGEGHLERASRAIERALAATGKIECNAWLWMGFTGVAWALELLQGREPGEGDNEVDQALPGLVASWTDSFDLMTGVSGLAVYALEREPCPSVTALLGAIVDRLAKMSERRAPGVTWPLDPRWLPPGASHVAQVDCDLGVGHGVAGVIAVLARIHASAAADARTKRRARSLLDDAVAWLLAQELPPGSGCCFPHVLGLGPPRAPRRPSRLAWCRGDPGIAAALAVAARCTGEDDWLRAARRVALVAAARPFEGSGVRDAGLCHGAAGVGHLLGRVYRATGDTRLGVAARAWLMRAVAMRTDRVYGWKTDSPLRGEGAREGTTPGLLMGAGGIALALLAATGDADASWDRAMGISAREIERDR
jgi:lantibiotic modifying enzyme